MLDLALVGTGGMLPLPTRWLASVLIRYASHLVLFDCGEGTQISLRALGWGIKDIDLILISHVHGDHITGLPGLLLSQANSERTAPVRIAGPPGFCSILQGLRVVAPYLPFEVHCQELAANDCLALDELQITCTAGEHHVPQLTYRLDLPRAPRFRPERAQELGVAVEDWKRLQKGETVGEVQPSDVLGPRRRGLSVGLVTDTRPTNSIASLIENADLLICEGTYGTDEDQPRAVERRHMTFREAATLAKQAGVKQLVLSHYSPALVNPEAYVDNARAVFPNTLIGHDHLTLTLRFPAD